MLSPPLESEMEKPIDSYSRHPRTSRPLVSFVEMINEALEHSSSGMLSLQEIYESVKKRYPYFRSKDTAWQNSIRHNLSMQSCFYKIDRPANRPGKGSLWVSNRSGRPSNTKSLITPSASPGRKYSEEFDDDSLGSVHKMPPLVNDYCTPKDNSPQIHSWSGDLWLETSFDQDSILLDVRISPVKEKDTFSDSSSNFTIDVPTVPRMMDLADMLERDTPLMECFHF